jgi:hypothetical protein
MLFTLSFSYEGLQGESYSPSPSAFFFAYSAPSVVSLDQHMGAE